MCEQDPLDNAEIIMLEALRGIRDVYERAKADGNFHQFQEDERFPMPKIDSLDCYTMQALLWLIDQETDGQLERYICVRETIKGALK